MTNIFTERSNINDKLDKKYEKLKKKQFKIDMRLSHLKKLSQKRCLHKPEYGRNRWANMRDDASFNTYVSCKKCDETLWDECK